MPAQGTERSDQGVEQLLSPFFLLISFRMNCYFVRANGTCRIKDNMLSPRFSLHIHHFIFLQQLPAAVFVSSE